MAFRRRIRRSFRRGRPMARRGFRSTGRRRSMRRRSRRVLIVGQRF